MAVLGVEMTRNYSAGRDKKYQLMDCDVRESYGDYRPTDFRGRPPFIPFVRDAAAFAGDETVPPFFPISAASNDIHARVPKMPDSKDGTSQSASSFSQ